MKKGLFFLFILPLFAFAHPFEDAVFEKFEESSQRWIEFKNNLTLYLEGQKPLPRRAEEDELESYFSEKQETSYQDLQREIAELQDAFWNFRDKLGTVFSHGTQGLHSGCCHALADEVATGWYTALIEKYVFNMEPGKKREIKAELNLNQEAERGFPYSFVEPPYINPHAVDTITPPWPCCEYNDNVAVELWNGQRTPLYQFEEPGFGLHDPDKHAPWFKYACLGKTDQNVYVLMTHASEGGTGVFDGLVFVTIEVEPYFADEDQECERVVLKRVGEHCLGDRWYGDIQMKGNQVTILTEGYGWGRGEELEPTTITVDLQHFFPTRPLNPVFAERLVTKSEDGPLFWALYQDKVEELSDQLQKGVSDELVQRLLLLSSCHGCFKSLSLFLDYGGDPNFSDFEGNTPLHKAVYEEEFACVQKLVEKGAAINAKNQDGDTPLVLAIKRSNSEIVNYLLEHGAAYDLVDQEGKNLLYYALYHGREPEIAETLFSLGVEANLPEMLPEAADLGSQLIVHHMIEQGVDVDAKNQSEETALFNCFGYRGLHEELAEYLIEQGADPFALRWGEAPILKIICCHNMRLLKKCLARGLDLNQEKTEVSALYRAAEWDWMEGVTALLEHGADVNQQNSSGFFHTGRQTALHAATANGNLEMVKLLREHGANLAPADVKSPFAIAAEHNRNEILRYFIEQGFLDQSSVDVQSNGRAF